MVGVIRKVTEISVKQIRKISEIDPSNPLTQDTAAFFLDVAKEIIKPW